MKISKSKRQLAQLIIEAGVTQFPKGANWAAQDKRAHLVTFYKVKPRRDSGCDFYAAANGCCWSRTSSDFEADTLITNWHQTKLSRYEFDQIVAETAPDADGWVGWSGGECPVGGDVVVCCKWRSGKASITAHRAGSLSWRHNGNAADIIAYRIHKPERVETVEYNYSGVVYTGPVKSEFVVNEKPTLDRLLQDWRNADDFAQRKQAEADEAAAMLNERWKAVQARAGEVGVTVELCESVAAEPELVADSIAWDDLFEGDEMLCVIPFGGAVNEGSVGKIRHKAEGKITVDFPEQRDYVYYRSHFERGDVKLIRRP